MGWWTTANSDNASVTAAIAEAENDEENNHEPAWVKDDSSRTLTTTTTTTTTTPPRTSTTTSTRSSFSGQDVVALTKDGDDDHENNASISHKRGLGCLVALYLPSLVLLMVFIVATAHSNNVLNTDMDAQHDLHWPVFYALHATAICLVMALHCFPCKTVLKYVFYALLVGIGALLVWSCILLFVRFGKLAQDNNDSNKEALDAAYQNKDFELAGAALGIVSCLWHLILFKCL